MKKIGIFGGTFSPVHNEHVSLARAGINELGLDALYVLPTNVSPHKKSTGASATCRLNMLKLAFSLDEKVIVSDYEITRGEVSYSYITAEYFNQKFGVKPYMFVGADMLKDFKTWKFPERILNSATLVCAKREGENVDISKEIEYIESAFGAQVLTLNFGGKACSSTKIRLFASLSLSLDGMVDKSVEEYIVKNKLYRGDSITEFLISALPEKRRIHTANVCLTALKWAKELGLLEEKVKISALLHDVAKYLNPSDYKDFVLESDVPKPVIHAFLGAHVAEKVLKITDTDIINAIKYHTSGRPNMSDLEKLIFVADMVEEGRNYQGVDYLREIYNKDFNASFIECLKEETIHLKNKKAEIYRLTLDAYEYYVKGDK